MNPTVEQTVEQALQELREMFPSTRWIEISCGQYARDSLGPIEYAVKFEAPYSQGKAFRESTLKEAMAQVRAWKESQQ